MIRINLLQGTRDDFSAPSEAESPAAFQARVFAGTLAAAAVVLTAFYVFTTHRVSVLDSRLAIENAEAARLAAIQAENSRYAAQLADIEGRANAIQVLEEQRQGPVRLMELVAAAVNKAPGLYLRSVAPKDNRLVFSGSSATVSAIADLVAALETTPDVHDVELREYFEEDAQDGRAAFKFTVDCVFQPASRAPAKPAAALPAGGGVVAGRGA